LRADYHFEFYPVLQAAVSLTVQEYAIDIND
jgi:hypothetical protein